MPNMLECWLVLKLRWHHRRFMGNVIRWRTHVIIIVVVIKIFLAIEVCWSFMFVCSSILRLLAQKISVWGHPVKSHTKLYRCIISPISLDEYSYNFLLFPKIMTATSTEQRTESSCAFLNNPPLRLRKVLQEACQQWVTKIARNATYTERFLSSFIALISIFLRPILNRISGPSRVFRVVRVQHQGYRDGRLVFFFEPTTRLFAAVE